VNTPSTPSAWNLAYSAAASPYPASVAPSRSSGGKNAFSLRKVHACTASPASWARNAYSIASSCRRPRRADLRIDADRTPQPAGFGPRHVEDLLDRRDGEHVVVELAVRPDLGKPRSQRFQLGQGEALYEPAGDGTTVDDGRSPTIGELRSASYVR